MTKLARKTINQVTATYNHQAPALETRTHRARPHITSMFEEFGGDSEKLSTKDVDVNNRLGFMNLEEFCKKHDYCYCEPPLPLC